MYAAIAEVPLEMALCERIFNQKLRNIKTYKCTCLDWLN